MAQVSAAKSQDRGMKESFAALLEESLGTSESLEGTVVKGTVLNIENDMVLIDVGLKSEGRVALKEFAVPGQPVELKIGDTVEVYLERMEDKHGEAMLSREKASAKRPGPSWSARSPNSSASPASSSAASRAASRSTCRAPWPSCRAARWTSARCATSPR